jgi:uncharacterized protein YuzE
MLHIEHDKEADAVYIQLIDEPIGYTKALDDNRLIDYTINPGKPVGVDLLAVSGGVNLKDLPEAETIGHILKGLGIKSHNE